jgi:hypothetical protein
MSTNVPRLTEGGAGPCRTSPFSAAFQEAIRIPTDAFEAEFRSQVVLEETRG